MASTLPSSSQTRSSPFSAGTLVAGLTGGFAIVTITGLIAAPLAGLSSIPVEARLWIAYGVLLVVGLLSGFVVAIWRALHLFVAAILTGVSGALFLWLIRVLLLEGGPYNRLVFGPIGMISVVVTAATGGWIAYLLDGDRLHARYRLSDAATVGVWAAALWLSFEMVGRMLGGFGLDALTDSLLAGELLGLLIAMPAAALVIARYGQAHGISAGDWEYRWTLKPIGFGVVAGLLALGLMAGTALIDAALWPMPEDALSGLADGLQDGAWVAALLLIVNALLAPICEELAWRGVVQTALVRACGMWFGILATALLFAMKHVVIDASFGRVTTLLMLGLVLGIARQRWGTGSSTVAHVVVNLYSTTVVIASV